jgi:hypothetical protein
MVSIVGRPWRMPVVDLARADNRRYRRTERRRFQMTGVPLLVVPELNMHLLLEMRLPGGLGHDR